MRKTFTGPPVRFVAADRYVHAALRALDEVESVIGGSRIEQLLLGDGIGGDTGRPGYPALTRFRAVVSVE